MSEEKELDATFLIIGGGIAGVTCTELLSYLAPEEKVILMTASPFVKAVTHFQQTAQVLEEFEVEEKPIESLAASCSNLTVIKATAIKLDSESHEIHTSDGTIIKYKKLCLTAGGKPKLIAEGNPYVLGIRDTETVQTFRDKIKNAKCIMVVGNGGIATELVYEIEGCKVIWAIKDKSISSTFFDPGAAEFLIPYLNFDKDKTPRPVKRLKYSVSGGTSKNSDSIVPGSALGPDWANDLSMTGSNRKSHDVHVEFDCEVKALYSKEDFARKKLKVTQYEDDYVIDSSESWPVYVELTNGRIFGVDFIVSATGVIPNIDPFLDGNQFDVADDGGIKVDGQMKTNVPDVFAAGDICTANWEPANEWFQMRLWTQARQMGAYAAKCLLADLNQEEITMDFCFELFTHITKFFGFKVVLLGLFNGQKLGKDYEVIVRISKGFEFVKVVMQNGRMKGAILIGETNLEETFENLILTKIDLSRYGEDLLNPEIDIEDYFD